MNSIASVSIIGYLGADPELRVGPQDRPVTRFRVAVNTGRKGADGQWQEHTDWFTITAFGPLAQRAAERLARGLRVFVTGRLQTRVWEGSDGPRIFLDVIAQEVIPLDRHEQPHRAGATDAESLADEREDSDDLPF